GLDPDDRVILLVGGQVVGGLPLEGGAVHATPGGPHTTVIGRTRYRVLLAGTLDEQKSTTLGVVSPQSKIDAANWDAERRLLIGLLGSLVLVAIVAYFEGRAIVRTIRRLVDAARAIARGDLRERVPVQGRDELALLGRTFNQMAGQLQTRLDELAAERERLRDAISRFGDVLGATHDVDHDARMTAAALAAQAAIALENARPHRIVERQARVDGLTGLANRRQCEDQLATELARVERFGGPLAVVFGDLDNFKDVNDRFGHPTGDVVLREFAHTLEEG